MFRLVTFHISAQCRRAIIPSMMAEVHRHRLHRTPHRQLHRFPRTPPLPVAMIRKPSMKTSPTSFHAISAPWLISKTNLIWWSSVSASWKKCSVRIRVIWRLDVSYSRQSHRRSTDADMVECCWLNFIQTFAVMSHFLPEVELCNQVSSHRFCNTFNFR